MFLYNLSYNGAWWFVLTYVILLVLSSVLAYAVKKASSLILLIGSSVIYFIAYLLRFKIVIELQNPVLDWILHQSILFGTSQYTYIVGMLFYKNRWISKLRKFSTAEGRNTNMSAEKRHLRMIVLTVVVPLLVLIGHCFVQSVFLAPFTAITVLIALFLTKIPNRIDSVLTFLGKHSTNIWLVHMFFYSTLFEGLVFYAKYPVLIVTAMFLLCIAVSLFVNMMYVPICNWMADREWI